MHLFPENLDISPTEGFSPHKDIFGRHIFGRKLTNLVRRLKGGNVLLLDAKWGTGKTTFVKMWQGDLSQAGLRSVYFDAFAHDYQQDAFISLASQIIGAGDEALASDGAKKNFKKRAIQVAKIVGRTTMHVGLKALTTGLVDASDLEEGMKDIALEAGSEGADQLDKRLERRLEGHKAEQGTFEQFRLALNELAQSIADPNKDTSAESGEHEAVAHPLIFIIDELDRCRPSFALEILEVIKHFFSVPNVIFVLVSNLSSLEAAVKYAYGDIDATTYLEKFYHLRVLFPRGRADQLDLGAQTYLKFLKCPANVADIISAFSIINEIPLRTLERVVAYVKIIQASMSEKKSIPPAIVAVLCLLKVMKSELYNLARAGNLTYANLDKFLKLNDWKNPMDASQPHPERERVVQWWAMVLGEPVPDSLRAQVEPSLFQDGLTVDRLIFHFCDLIDCFALPDA